MARVLIGWELGGGRGHALAMLAAAEALSARGHDVALAVQRLVAVREPLPPRAILLQAPLWPRLVVGEAAGAPGAAVTIFDILARLGLDRPGALAGMLRAWDGVLASFRPDLVIGDFAPALIAAAYGRVPTMTTGPGFQSPPAEASEPARLGGDAPGFDEAALLDIVDAELRDAGREALPALPALFRRDRTLIASFPELDPYARPDGPDFIAPASGDWSPPGEGVGDEIFVYANGPVQRMDPFWRALAATGLLIRAHVPWDEPGLHARIAAMGVRIERRPVPWPQIAARSRVCVNHGAHGVMCGALLAGLPQLTVPIDLEKTLHSVALERAGLGVALHEPQLPPERLTASVRALYEDATMLARVREAAPRFAARCAVPYGEAVAEAAALLV